MPENATFTVYFFCSSVQRATPQEARYVSVITRHRVQTVTSFLGRGSQGFLQVGGRADIRKEINEINFVASLTDSTIRGYDAAPYLPDAIITADKRINSKLVNLCEPSTCSNFFEL